MARIRSVKPEYWTSEQVMNMSRDARLLFIGLWTFCDDNGIHPASALSLKAEVLPGDTLTADQVMVFIDEMIEQGLVEEYEVDGRAFWRVTGWRRHQRIDQPTYRHPTGDTQGDTGDAGDTSDTKGDRVTGVTYKRLGGKQRQIVLRKLRERDGDACHLCGDTSNLSILSLAANGDENTSDINSLRLICSGCKRGRKRGDTRNLGGDTKGDTKALGGDSPTEWSGEESIGGVLERNGIQTLTPHTTTAQPEVRQDPEQRGVIPSDETTATVGQLCIAMRAYGINADPGNMLMRKLAADGVTVETMRAACEEAKRSRPAGAISPNYVIGIIARWAKEAAALDVAGAAAPAPATARAEPDWAWRKSNSGIDAKGREMGMFARNGESYPDFANRIQAELEKRRGGKAA